MLSPHVPSVDVEAKPSGYGFSREGANVITRSEKKLDEATTAAKGDANKRPAKNAGGDVRPETLLRWALGPFESIAVRDDYKFLFAGLGLGTRVPRTARQLSRFWRDDVGSLCDPRKRIVGDFDFYAALLADALAYELPSPVGGRPRWVFSPTKKDTSPTRRGKPRRQVVRKCVTALDAILLGHCGRRHGVMLVRLLWLAGFGPLFPAHTRRELSKKIEKLIDL
jgi:hypothetical protein